MAEDVSDTDLGSEGVTQHQTSTVLEQNPIEMKDVYHTDVKSKDVTQRQLSPTFGVTHIMIESYG